ncbi:MAG: ABC transporter ATP-binding protein [Candidatus Zixiibacteriota bacterium]
MSETAIKIKSVTKTYRLYRSHADRVKETFHPLRKKYNHPFNALENISLNVRKGSSIGIIGRNGSGKSTLLQIICGILKPTTGIVEVNGRISALLELGAGFNPEFTGVENVYLSASILGISQKETEKRFDEITSFADIGDFIHQPVKTYSSGMYIRLAFAIAVHVYPEILVIDEALTVGDIFFQQKCIHHMQELMKGCTRVIATHDMQAVANMCEKVYVLDQGNIVYNGSPLKGIEYYTKIMHNEQFATSCKVENTNLIQKTGNIIEDRDWIEVTEDSRAGACEIIIEKVKLTSRGYEKVNIVKTNDYLVINFIIFSAVQKKSVIFGYLIKDRVGNAIFGENTVDCPTGPVDIEDGYHYVQLGFRWPEIYPDEYTLTVGVGEGNDAIKHIIQCWAHNILSISAISLGKSIHAVFNNPITSMEIHPID